MSFLVDTKPTLGCNANAPQDGGSPQLLRFSPNLLHPAYPYGTVQKGCSLRLRGLLLPLILINFEEMIATSKSMGGRGALQHCRFKLDKQESESRLVGHGMGANVRGSSQRVDDILLLELRIVYGAWQGQCSGLVLKWVRANTFIRLGSFDFSTVGDDRKSEESVDDWKQGIDSDYDWFQNCAPRDITLE